MGYESEGTPESLQRLVIGGVLLEDAHDLAAYSDLFNERRASVMVMKCKNFLKPNQVSDMDIGIPYVYCSTGEHGEGYYIDDDNAPWQRRLQASGTNRGAICKATSENRQRAC